MKTRLLNCSLFVAVALTASGLRAENSPAPDFTLTKWGTNETVKLADFAGQIVVLDFFAYWCVPCRRASAEIEPGIQKYYEIGRASCRERV